jgi:hypothetical protein
MDFDLRDTQRERLEALRRVVETAGGAHADPGHLDPLLSASDVLSGASVLECFLIAEELAGLGLASTVGLRGLLGDLVPETIPPGPIAVTEAHRAGPVRFADTASAVVVLDEDDARIYEPAHAGIAPARASFGYPYAHVNPAGPGWALPAGAGRQLRARWRLAVIAEVSGNADSAIRRTADHLTSRVQFGRPLGSFQALRHRLADSAVSAEATRWLGREAAYQDDARSVARAAWYASDTAATLVPELLQMCGARGFTHEFGLHLFIMRLNCLRLELGGIDRLGLELSRPAVDHDAAVVAAGHR